MICLLLIAAPGCKQPGGKSGQQYAQVSDDSVRERAALLDARCGRAYALPADSLKRYALELKELADKGLPYGGRADYYLALYYTKQNMNDSAMVLLKHYEAGKEQDRATAFDFKALKVHYYEALGNRAAALKTTMQLLGMATRMADTNRKIKAYVQAAIQNRHLEHSENLKKYLYRAAYEGGIDGHAAAKAQSEVFVWLAIYYDENEIIPDSFSFYTDKAIQVAERTGNLTSLACALNWKANTLVRRMKVRLALPYLRKSDSLFSLLNDKRYAHRRFLLAYDYYQGSGHISKAIALAKAEIQKEKARPSVGRLFRLYNTLRITYGEQQDHKHHAAYADSTLYEAMDMYEKISAAELANFEAEYSIKEKEAALALSQLKLSQAENKRLIYLTVFMLLALAGLMYLYHYRKRQRYRIASLMETERLKKEAAVQQAKEKERNRISKELHDNIGAQLSYIRSNINFMKEAPDGLERKVRTAFLDNIEAMSQDAITSLRESIWVLHRDKVDFEELADKLKENMERRLGSFFRLEMGEHITVRWQMNPMEALHILRIFQEAATNALKHSGAERVCLFITSLKEEQFNIVFSDDGRGFKETASMNDSYGLCNMRERASEFDFRINISSGLHIGTTITLRSAEEWEDNGIAAVRELYVNDDHD